MTDAKNRYKEQIQKADTKYRQIDRHKQQTQMADTQIPMTDHVSM